MAAPNSSVLSSIEIGNCIAVQVCMLQIPILVLFTIFYVSSPWVSSCSGLGHTELSMRCDKGAATILTAGSSGVRCLLPWLMLSPAPGTCGTGGLRGDIQAPATVIAGLSW